MKITKIDVSRPECAPSIPIVSAVAHLDCDLTELLPYLNATQEKAQYFPNHPYLRFMWRGYNIVVERNQVRVVPFVDDQAAKAGASEVVDLIREIEAKKDEITPDHTAYEPPAVMDILKLLPKKSGCGKCGYPSCMAFAAALTDGEVELKACPELERDSVPREYVEKLKELLS
ncbi:MAG: hypothetical protein JSU92_03820 [Deltaproteobacteria bacterium]|nr:MAG: hypothetical protein JSU92_03820 [Deltaproteobacteria bacterium]